MDEYKYFSSIKDIDEKVAASLRYGPLSSQPGWYRCFEEMLGASPDHLFVDIKGVCRKLIPLYHFCNPTNIFTHNLPFLLLGGLFHNDTAKHDVLGSLYPVAISVPPFSYRYSVCCDRDNNLTLSKTDIAMIERRSWDMGARICGFLYLDGSQKEMRKLLTESDYVEFPIAVRWELGITPFKSYESWLSNLPSKKRTRMAKDWKSFEENKITAEIWGANEIKNNFEILSGLTRAHYAKYGFNSDLQESMATSMHLCLTNFGPNVVCFVARQNDEYIGYTFCIESDSLLYVKFPGFGPNTKYAYFLTTYHLPLKYALTKGLNADFSLTSDQVKSGRGLKPVVVYAYCKFKDIARDVVNYLIQENHKSFLSYRYNVIR